MNTVKSVEIPVDKASVERLKKWCKYYGMTAKKKKGHIWEVSNYNDIDLYWLGCNMTLPFKSGITKSK